MACQETCVGEDVAKGAEKNTPQAKEYNMLGMNLEKSLRGCGDVNRR